MTQQEKHLLLKDLSARLPYGVKFGIGSGKLGSYNLVEINAQKEKILYGAKLYIDLDICKPYLRPMSSMTEEEQKEFDEFCVIDEDAWMDKGISGYVNQAEIMSKGVDWLNNHNFDYRGLIKKGLAVEAPKDMYNK